MKSKILKRLALRLLFIVAVGLVSCGEKEKDEKWIWERYGMVVTLTFYPNGENEGKFYSTVVNDNGFILFHDDVWLYYKIEGDMMYIRRKNEEFPSEGILYNKWFIRQHTENILELEHAGILPDIPIVGNYLFKKAQN